MAAFSTPGNCFSFASIFLYRSTRCGILFTRQFDVRRQHAIRLKAALDVHQAVEAGGQQSRHQDEGDADGDFRRDQGFAQLFAAARLAGRA